MKFGRSFVGLHLVNKVSLVDLQGGYAVAAGKSQLYKYNWLFFMNRFIFTLLSKALGSQEQTAIVLFLATKDSGKLSQSTLR